MIPLLHEITQLLRIPLPRISVDKGKVGALGGGLRRSRCLPRKEATPRAVLLQGRQPLLVLAYQLGPRPPGGCPWRLRACPLATHLQCRPPPSSRGRSRECPERLQPTPPRAR